PSLTSAEELRPVSNPEQLGFSAARLQRLTEHYQGYVDRGELPGAVLLIARGEKIAYLRAIGYQDREKQTPMKVDAIFRLASMTDHLGCGDDARRGRQARPAGAGLAVPARVQRFKGGR